MNHIVYISKRLLVGTGILDTNLPGTLRYIKADVINIQTINMNCCQP